MIEPYSINQWVEKIVGNTEMVRKQIREMILALPDNRQAALSENPRCFVVKSSEWFDGVLSPESYDFRHQYEAVARVIDSLPIERVVTKLEALVIPDFNGAYWLTQVGNSRIRLHPEVVKNLKTVMG